uniref:Uncharacterized protein n=1 Tax=Setaria digitata TaxID=48799 RepID=A0A915Q5B8_9BILA
MREDREDWNWGVQQMELLANVVELFGRPIKKYDLDFRICGRRFRHCLTKELHRGVAESQWTM